MILFLSFPEMEDLTFHANCLQSRKFSPLEKPVFSQNKETFSICRLLKILPRVLSVNASLCTASDNRFANLNIFLSCNVPNVILSASNMHNTICIVYFYTDTKKEMPHCKKKKKRKKQTGFFSESHLYAIVCYQHENIPI